MLKLSRCAAMARMSVLAGVTVMAMDGFTATAQAFPTFMPTPVLGSIETVQYRDDGYSHRGRHYRHHDLYGVNAHANHPGRAGLYDCGPGGKSTRLSRKACGGNNRFQHLQQAY